MAANNNTNIPGLLPAAAQAALNAAYLANHPNPLALINQLHPLGVNPGAPVIDSPDKELLIESEAGEQLVQEVGQQNMRSMIKKCYEEDRVITKDMVDIWGQVRANIAEYRAKCKILSRPETAAIGSELRSGRPDLQQQALVKAANVMEVKRTLKFLATKIHRQRGEYLVLGKIRYRKFKRRMLGKLALNLSFFAKSNLYCFVRIYECFFNTALLLFF